MHNVHFGDYPENVCKKSVQKEWDDYARHEDWQEGCSGLPQNIRWIDYVCGSREEAENYIEKHDNGWYDQLAVKYLDRIAPTTKAYKDLIARRDAIFATLQERQNKVHYSSQNTKAEYVTCKHCGSRLSTKHIKSNSCPLCGMDLRPASALSAIDTSKKMYNEVLKKIKAVEVKSNKKGKVRWLVKIEYHT